MLPSYDFDSVEFHLPYANSLKGGEFDFCENASVDDLRKTKKQKTK